MPLLVHVIEYSNTNSEKCKTLSDIIQTGNRLHISPPLLFTIFIHPESLLLCINCTRNPFIIVLRTQKKKKIILEWNPVACFEINTNCWFYYFQHISCASVVQRVFYRHELRKENIILNGATVPLNLFICFQLLLLPEYSIYAPNISLDLFTSTYYNNWNTYRVTQYEMLEQESTKTVESLLKLSCHC